MPPASRAPQAAPTHHKQTRAHRCGHPRASDRRDVGDPLLDGLSHGGRAPERDDDDENGEEGEDGETGEIREYSAEKDSCAICLGTWKGEVW
jgi:hypothetical protein